MLNMFGVNLVKTATAKNVVMTVKDGGGGERKCGCLTR